MIVERIDRPAARIVDGFRSLLRYDSLTCAVSDSLDRFNAMTSDMRPIFEGIRFVGTAVTAKTLASDLAAAFKAIDVCEAGDVIVIDSHGSVNTAFWGENMTLSAINRGVVAAIVDGACRDVEEIRTLRFPVLCKGFVPNVGSISGYGHVNVPVACAGVVVSPGDIIIADASGVVVVPKQDAERVLQSSTDLLRTEGILQEKIKAGSTIGQLINVDAVLASTFSYQERATDRTK